MMIGAVLLLLPLLCSVQVPALAVTGSDSSNATEAVWGPYLTAMDTTSVQVRWHGDGVTGVLYRPAGGDTWAQAAALSAGEGFWYAPLTRLAPSSSYEYRLAGEDGGPYRFTTFPVEGPVTFAVVGDTQDDPALPVPDGRTSLVAETLAGDEDCMFLLHLGDTVGDPHNEAEWGRFFGEMGPVISHVPIYPVMGNHERNLPVWYAAFGYPQWYNFTCGDATVIVLDSNDWAAPRAEEQDAWLRETLAASEGTTFVAYHHPAYADDSRHPEGWRQFADRWEPLFAAYDVPLILSGHVHAYERYERDGRVWIVAGTGGGPPSVLTAGKGEGCIVAFERTLGYVRVSGDRTDGWSGTYLAAGEIIEDGGVRRFGGPQVVDAFALPSTATSPVSATEPATPANTPLCLLIPAAALVTAGMIAGRRPEREKVT